MLDFFAIILFSFLAVVGACMGSFSSAIAYRITKGESWIGGVNTMSGHLEVARSKCPTCKHPLKWFDLFPVLSWLSTQGHCRYCQQKISIRYPIIEMLGAGLLTLFYGLAIPSELELVLFIMGLPFLLSTILLGVSKFSIPMYLWGIVFLEAGMLIFMTV
jgi:leader peptidase (prepilin peptidase)/N-methyltransferase